jgi:hypothetical protein
MIIYKTRWFNRWARKQGLGNFSLCTAVREMVEGLYDADLGGGLFKKRIARPGQGKRSGFRTLVVTNRGDQWFFVFGFPKNERNNIDTALSVFMRYTRPLLNQFFREILVLHIAGKCCKNEEEALKKLAIELLSLTAGALEIAKQNDELIEVDCDAEEEISDS